MTTVKQSHLRTDARHILRDHALVVVTYLGIVATFAIASLIGSAIWLLIW